MSTRCQIAFITMRGGRREERWVYRHWDGYPDGVLPDLQAFIAWNGGGMAHVEYCAANFLFWSKLRATQEEFRDEQEQQVPTTEAAVGRAVVRKYSKIGNVVGHVSAAHTGFGVCLPGEFHGDIEYFYEVVTDEAGTRIVVYEMAGNPAHGRAGLRLVQEVRAPP